MRSKKTWTPKLRPRLKSCNYNSQKKRAAFMTTLYGIPNCDTIKKARKWLDDKNIAYEFHDYKKAGIDRKTLKTGARNLVTRH